MLEVSVAKIVSSRTVARTKQLTQPWCSQGRV